jgi:hypothetical protein
VRYRNRATQVGKFVALVLTLFLSLVVAPASSGAAESPNAGLGALQQLARAEVAYYQSQLPAGTVVNCIAPAGNPAFGTPAWTLRDLENELCATGRLQDEYTNPAFNAALLSETPAIYSSQLLAQLGRPGHLEGGVTSLVPGATTADPFRTLARWTSAGLGRVTPVSFRASDGAVLRGYVFEPPAHDPPPPSGYPGVTITDGSLQGFQQMYFWAAEGLAQDGYMVMTYDVQGEGESDLLPSNCLQGLLSSHSCPGVPFQQNYNFYQGAEDSLNFFLSSATSPYEGSSNPDAASLNDNDIALAGHSLGAAAVSEVGQCDKRVKTIVAWDDLTTVANCNGVDIPPADRSPTLLHAPALALTNDYFLNPEPMTSVPNAHAKDAGYRQLVSAGLNAEEVAIRGTTHLTYTYTYIPYALPAGSLAERVAFYYTQAWLNYEMRWQPSALQELTAKTFDASADVASIGAGTFDAAKALADPTNLTADNVPYDIAGLPVANLVSIYYESEYSLQNFTSGVEQSCSDMRADCPAVAPPTP